MDLRRCIDEVVALTQPRWKSEALGQGVTIQVETDVLDVPVIQGDAAAIRELLANLIFNAVDAMPEGGTISMRARVDGGDVRLEVKDTGIGMTEEVRQRCLDPFFSTKGQRGTGLGLSMVHATVEQHRGTLTVESEPGRGTAFIVRLPRQAQAGMPASEAAAPQPPRQLRVLVVEDEPIVRMSVVAQLENQGHFVDSATNGRQGLDKFMSGRFDLVVTDRAMPEMGGDELAASIERLAPDTPVIMLTGFGDLMEAKGEQPAGVDAVLGKPVTFDALSDAIRQVSGPGEHP